MPPPFLRNQPPKQRLHEENELIWDDGVAPETCIDFDASHIPSSQGLFMWLCGLGFFATVATIITISDPQSLNKVTPRAALFGPLDFKKAVDEDEDEDE